jgi:hypothetical protein
VTDAEIQVARELCAKFDRAEASALQVAGLLPATLDALVNARAERDEALGRLPRCLGEWIGGSGGHRVYAPVCALPGKWDVGLGFVCDEHKNKYGGDADAWEWEREREQLEAELTAMRAVVEAACALRDLGIVNESHGAPVGSPCVRCDFVSAVDTYLKEHP